MWAPIYSPDYNPIEMMFSKLKGIVKRIRLKDMLKEEGKTFPELLIGATKQIEVSDVNNCISNVLKLFEF